MYVCQFFLVVGGEATKNFMILLGHNNVAAMLFTAALRAANLRHTFNQRACRETCEVVISEASFSSSFTLLPNMGMD